MTYYLDKYKFCPLCASHLKKVSNFLECTKCSYRIFNNEKPVVNIIIENERQEILLVVRARDPFKGWYDLPGGFCDTDESLEGTGQREVSEELGVEVKTGKYIGSFPLDYPYRGLIYKQVVAYFSGKIDEKKIKIGDDAAGFEFVPRSEVLKKKICTPEGNIEALKVYLELFK